MAVIHVPGGGPRCYWSEFQRSSKRGESVKNEDDERKYTVGYCRPPEKSQFQKGNSGNPAGRPKGRQNLVTTLERTLNENVVINENGQRKTISKLDAAVKRLVNKAIEGD